MGIKDIGKDIENLNIFNKKKNDVEDLAREIFDSFEVE